MHAAKAENMKMKKCIDVHT